MKKIIFTITKLTRTLGRHFSSPFASVVVMYFSNFVMLVFRNLSSIYRVGYVHVGVGVVGELVDNFDLTGFKIHSFDIDNPMDKL